MELFMKIIYKGFLFVPKTKVILPKNIKVNSINHHILTSHFSASLPLLTLSFLTDFFSA